MLRHLVQNKIRKITDQSRLFANDARGTVAVIFGISIIPLMLAMGLAVDFSTTIDTRSKLDAAADAAALAGATGAKNYLARNQNSGFSLSALNANAIAEGQREAKTYFDSNLSKVVLTQNIQKSVNVNIAIQNREVTSTVTYDADAQLAFGPLIQINQFHVSNTVVAASALPTYLDIYVVLDNSGSMGIGATQPDIDLMKANFGNCEVACHANNFTTQSWGGSYPDARAKGITMRIDVLRNAISSMLLQADKLKTTNDLFRFNLLTFSNDLVPLKMSSTDYTALNAAISSLGLSTGEGGTNFHYAIGHQLPPLVPTSQDGSGALNRKTHIVIVTDGVEDSRWQSTYPTSIDPNYVKWYGNAQPYGADNIQAFDPSICNALKSKGADVTVLNVKYIAPLNSNSEFDYVRNNILGHEANTIAGCASNSGSYYSANSPQEIQAAIDAIFGKLLRTARLTH